MYFKNFLSKCNFFRVARALLAFWARVCCYLTEAIRLCAFSPFRLYEVGNDKDHANQIDMRYYYLAFLFCVEKQSQTLGGMS
jgi:hypothetical protein